MKVEDPRGPVSKSFTEKRKKTASRVSSIFSLLDYQRGGCFRGVFPALGDTGPTEIPYIHVHIYPSDFVFHQMVAPRTVC